MLHLLKTLFLLGTFSLAHYSLALEEDRYCDENKSSEFCQCGSMSGAKVVFKRPHGDLNFSFFPVHGEDSPLSFTYPHPEIVVTPTYRDSSCRGFYDNAKISVRLIGETAQKIIYRLLEIQISLTENEQKHNMIIRQLGVINIFTKGIDCQILKGSKNGHRPTTFRCHLLILPDSVTTVGGGLKSPRPKMGAGNATSLYNWLIENHPPKTSWPPNIIGSPPSTIDIPEWNQNLPNTNPWLEGLVK